MTTLEGVCLILSMLLSLAALWVSDRPRLSTWLLATALALMALALASLLWRIAT